MVKFLRPPLSDSEKEKLAEKFVDGAARLSSVDKPLNGKKEPKEAIFLRVPKSLADDLDRIYKFTGYKKNVFCLHAIMEAVKEKLKQIEREQ